MMLGNGEDSDCGPRASSGSEVALVTDQVEASPIPNVSDLVSTAAREVPNISNMNISNARNIHVGTKIVTVTQNVHTNEVVKGRFLGLELVSPQHAKRLRCCVAVFLCWAFVIVAALAFYLIYIASTKQTILNIGLNETWYLRRPDWQALPPSSKYQLELLRLPVKIAMIGHSATALCSDRTSCIIHVRTIQKDHLERFGEIGPNFLVGGPGYVFEGAGANVVGTTIYGWNRQLISIMFLGDYSIYSPNQEQFDHVAVLLDQLVKDSILDPNYVLYGYCQIKTLTISPGLNIVHKLHEYPHWSSENSTLCLSKSLH